MQATAEAAPPVIRREAYQPPEWLVPEVALSFNLGLEQTKVVATLKVRRNGQSQTLRLRGDGLSAEAVLVDGTPSNAWRMDGDDLLIDLPGEAHDVAIATAINPAANSQLMGLYASNAMLCTQCEAEGFRRITFAPDRPDVLSVYTVRMEGPKALFPVLLSNGNCTATGDGSDGTHWAEWHDPWPKTELSVCTGRGRSGRQSQHFHHDVWAQSRSQHLGAGWRSRSHPSRDAGAERLDEMGRRGVWPRI